MNTSKLNEWIQAVGIFAVVASLIFVGLQMRQDLIIADATLYQMRADSSRELALMMAENSEARRVFQKMSDESYDDLTRDERAIFNFTFQSILNHFESSHYLYLQGLLSQEQWDSDVRQLQNIWRQANAKSYWTDARRATYRESFAREVDKVFE